MALSELELQEMYEFYQQLKNLSVVNFIQMFKNHRHTGIDFPKVHSTDLEGSSGGAPSSFIMTRALSDATGVVNVAHGLGRIPTHVRIYGITVAGSAEALSSFGTYDGSAHKCVYYSKNGANLQANQDTGFAVGFIPVGGSDIQTATISFDATDVSLSWTKAGSPSGNAYLIMEVY